MKYLPVKAQNGIRFICVKVTKEDGVGSSLPGKISIPEDMAGYLDYIESKLDVEDMLKTNEPSIMDLDQIASENNELYFCVFPGNYSIDIARELKNIAYTLFAKFNIIMASTKGQNASGGLFLDFSEA